MNPNTFRHLLPGWRAAAIAAASPVLPTAGLVAYYESDTFDGQSDTTAITTWPDKLGDANKDWTQATAGNKPWVSTTTLNGHNTVRCIYSTAPRYLGIATNGWLQALTAAEIFCVMKKDNDPAANGTATGDAGAPFQLNRQSGFSSHVSLTDGNFYENFGNATRPSLGNPTTSIANWCVYNLRKAAGTNNLVVYVETELLYNASQTWQQLGLNTVRLGSGSDGPNTFSFGGNVAALYIYDGIISAANHASAAAYLLYKWNLVTPSS